MFINEQYYILHFIVYSYSPVFSSLFVLTKCLALDKKRYKEIDNIYNTSFYEIYFFLGWTFYL